MSIRTPNGLNASRSLASAKARSQGVIHCPTQTGLGLVSTVHRQMAPRRHDDTRHRTNASSPSPPRPRRHHMQPAAARRSPQPWLAISPPGGSASWAKTPHHAYSRLQPDGLLSQPYQQCACTQLMAPILLQPLGPDRRPAGRPLRCGCAAAAASTQLSMRETVWSLPRLTRVRLR